MKRVLTIPPVVLISSLLFFSAILLVGQNSPKVKEGESLTLLSDAHVLMTGGFDSGSTVSATAFLADGTGNTVQLSAGLNIARAGHTATALPDGSVLIFGGVDSHGSLVRQAEKYDPSTQSFSLLPEMLLVPRAFHTATLLIDGRLVLIGGIEDGGSFPDDVQFWDYRTDKAQSFHASLGTPREGHNAVLLSDGRIFVSGGTDKYGKSANASEVFDPASETFSYLDTNPDLLNSADAPKITASIPADGAQDVPLDGLVAVRFSKTLDVTTISSANVTLQLSGKGTVSGSVVAAESGKLAFFIADVALQPGSSYQITFQGLKDGAGSELPSTTISFTTEGVPDDSPEDEWIPNSQNLAGNWNSGRGESKWQKLPPLLAPPGVTAVSGQVLRLSGYPLQNVTLEIDGKKTRSDHTGRFLLAGINAGHHVLVIDGRTADHGNNAFGLFEAGVNILASKTNVLNYTIWMTKLDTANAVRIPSPTTAADTVITTPRLPGLELHLPANTVIMDHDGKPATEISITAIPVDKPPFPLPPGVSVPIYFTIQPGGAYVDVRTSGNGPKGARLFYPNTHGQHPGAIYDFWNYDADAKGWYVYGQGRVNAQGTSIVPDPGVVVYEFTGAMVGLPTVAPPWFGQDDSHIGDPVNLSTGLFVYDKTDLVLPDVIPLTLARTYRTNDSQSRPFGIGFTHMYEMFTVGDTNPYTYQELILPDGERIHFNRISPGTSFTGAVYEHTATKGPFYGATITYTPTGIPPGTTWTLKMKDGTQYFFPDADNMANPARQALIGISDRYGNIVQLTRDSNSNLTKITSQNGRYITFQHDASNRITSATDNSGRAVQYTYDTNGRLSTVTDANNGVTTYTYDSNNNMLTIKDARGIVYLTNQYDANGRVIKQTNADGGIYQFAYTLSTNSAQTYFVSEGPNDPSPTSTLAFRACSDCTEGYLPLVSQVDVTDPRGYVRRVSFNSAGYTLSDTHALNQPEQQITTYQYYPDNLLQSVTDPLSRVTAYQYDINGNMTQLTRLSGTQNAVSTNFTYEPNFNMLSSITDPLNNTTSFLYDWQGNLVTTTDALGHQTTATFNSQGLPLTMTDAVSNTTRFGYSGGDLASITDPLNNTVNRFVDAVGRLASVTNPLGKTTTYQYNNLNQTTLITDPYGQSTGFTYDSNGNLLTLVDALNHTTTYTYDNMDRVQTRADSLTRQESYTYDLNGNMSTFTDRNGQLRSSSYDGLNRKTFVGFGTVAGNPPTYQSTINYTYDAGNRLTNAVDSVSGTITRGYDLLDRMTSESTPQGSISSTFDVANRRSTMIVAGQPQVSYTYDNANRLMQIVQSSNIVTFGYDNANRRTSLTLPNGIVVSYSYDNASELTALVYQLGANTLGNLTYAYDSAGRKMQVGGSFARTGLPNGVSSATYDAANELIQWGASTLSYDNNGNLLSDGTNTYSWDARNHLGSISGAVGTSFQYDSFGRRTARNSTAFLYDGFNSVQELAGGGLTANVLTGATDEHFLRSDISGTWNFLVDALGSTSALADSGGTIQTQYTYDAFGNSSQSGVTDSNTNQYTGRENDGTGLYYYRARYYSPILERFISEDPLGFGGNTVNLFEYAFDSPSVYADPTGKQAIIVLLQDPIIIDPALLEEAQQLAAPKNSLPLPDGGRLDLPPGSSHFDKVSGQDIPTPHVHEPLPPFPPPYDDFPTGLSRVPRPATNEDIQQAIDHNRAVPTPANPLPGRKIKNML